MTEPQVGASEFLVGAGVAIAVGMTGLANERRKRRKMLKQTIEHAYGLDSQSDLRHDVDDDDEGFDALLRERIAVDENQESMVWEDESFLPDADSFSEPASLGDSAVGVNVLECVAPRKTEQSRDTRHFSKPRRATKPPRESHRGALWFGLSLVVAFFCLFQALPRWSRTDGLSSAGTRRWYRVRVFRHQRKHRLSRRRRHLHILQNRGHPSQPTRPRVEPRHRPTRTAACPPNLPSHNLPPAPPNVPISHRRPSNYRNHRRTPLLVARRRSAGRPAGDLQPGDRVIDPHGANPSSSPPTANPTPQASPSTTSRSKASTATS